MWFLRKHRIIKNLRCFFISKFNIKVKFILRNIESELPYEDNEMDIVLCNYVLMFINPEKIVFVLEELLRVCNKFLVIDTYPKYHELKKLNIR